MNFYIASPPAFFLIGLLLGKIVPYCAKDSAAEQNRKPMFTKIVFINFSKNSEIDENLVNNS